MSDSIGKKRIAIIGLKGLPAFGGAAAVGENIIEELKDKYDFTVYSVDSHTDKKGNFNGYYQIVFKSLPLKKLNVLYYYLVSAFHAVFLGRYNLVHLHHHDAAFIILILKLKYKVILTTHGIYKLGRKWEQFSFYFKSQEKWFVKYADLITCVSLNELRFLQKNNLVHKAYYIPNGMMIEKNISEKIPKKSNYLMFSSARIIPTKGLDIFLKALKILDYKDKIIIAGDINQMPEYKNKLLSLSRNLNIKFLGLIRNKKILMSYLREAKYFIFPSSIEALSMMLLEAASVKTPIICSDIAENKDIFDDTEVLFFETDNSNDLADKLAWTLKHEKKMTKKAENAYKKLENKYLWRDITKKYDKLYQKILMCK